MANAEYQIVFRGEVTGELPEHAVKQNLAAMFKMPESRIEGLFSGKPVVVKKGVDEATARKFEAAFRKAGAICELQDLAGADPSAGASPSPQGASESPARGADDAASAGASATDERGAQAGAAAPQTASSAESIAAGSIAAAGDPNQTVVSKSVPEELGELEMSAPGEPLVTEERDKTPPAIDTSDLTITDEPLGDGRRAAGDDPGIDTSGLSIVPPE